MPTGKVFTGQSGSTWQYWADQPLGNPGQFGEVYAAANINGNPVAAKVINKRRFRGVIDDRLMRREIVIGQRVNANVDADMLLPVIDAADTKENMSL